MLSYLSYRLTTKMMMMILLLLMMMMTIVTSCAARWPPQYAPAPADRRPRPLRGQFVVQGQELPTAYVRTKFEGRSFIRLRNIGTFRCAALH